MRSFLLPRGAVTSHPRARPDGETEVVTDHPYSEKWSTATTPKVEGRTGGDMSGPSPTPHGRVSESSHLQIRRSTGEPEPTSRPGQKKTPSNNNRVSKDRTFRRGRDRSDSTESDPETQTWTTVKVQSPTRSRFRFYLLRFLWGSPYGTQKESRVRDLSTEKRRTVSEEYKQSTHCRSRSELSSSSFSCRLGRRVFVFHEHVILLKKERREILSKKDDWIKVEVIRR